MEDDLIRRSDVLALKQTPGAYGMDIDSRDVASIPAVDAVEIDALGNSLRQAIIAERDRRAREKAYGWEWEYNGFNFAIQAVGSVCIQFKRKLAGQRREEGDA